jgi:hypothetical protein
VLSIICRLTHSSGSKVLQNLKLVVRKYKTCVSYSSYTGMQAKGCMEQMEALNVLLLSTHPLTARQQLPSSSTDDSAAESSVDHLQQTTPHDSAAADFAKSAAAAAAAADANADDAHERAALKAEMEHVFTEAQQQLRYKLQDSPLYNASHELLMVTRRVLGGSSLAACC